MSVRTKFAAAAALTLLASVTAACTSSSPGEQEQAGQQHETSTCFWGPAFSATEQTLNYAFPDSGALYWAAQFAIPAGAELTLKGEYAHARYQSLNSYNITTNSPTSALNDVSTAPDPGSANPYLTGADRTGTDGRSYTATVRNEVVPVDNSPHRSSRCGAPTTTPSSGSAAPTSASATEHPPRPAGSTPISTTTTSTPTSTEVSARS
ncbi:hypothetical protein ACFWUP_19820 [Nocardia sp. NPDC058658]|uniref:hypothetical protein n=1 Tax=Nocardia sp. NPDC058658 TaxID=3346580 RepID=UPI003649B619